MNPYLIATAIGVAASATADGVSTYAFIKRGDVEVDPLMVLFYKTDFPSGKRILFTGGGLIAGELVAALALAHWFPVLTIPLIVGGIAQIVIHVVEVIRNRKLIGA
jgi:hypothetical protein